jgi:hypothetical protein
MVRKRLKQVSQGWTGALHKKSSSKATRQVLINRSLHIRNQKLKNTIENAKITIALHTSTWQWANKLHIYFCTSGIQFNFASQVLHSEI